MRLSIRADVGPNNGDFEMTDSTETVVKESKAKTVAEDMTARRKFPNAVEAIAYLSNCAATLTDFDDQVFATQGVSNDDEGNLVFDPAIYTPGMDVMISKLANREKGGKSTIKAVVITAAPSLDSILSAVPVNPSVREWLEKIVDKELNHVAVRQLRTAADVTTVADQMPTTLEAYISSGRESTGGIMETFNELFKDLIAAFAKRSPAWQKARLTKGELKKALESKAYALEYYPTLEDRADKDSLFVMALQLGINAAKKKGLDPAIFDRWLETRDAKAFDIEEEEEEDFDLDDLESEMTAEPVEETKAEEVEPAAE